MTYVAKAGTFGIIKVGDLFTGLKNVTSGAYTNVLAGGGRFNLDGTYAKNPDVPVVKGNYIEWPGGSRLNLDNGKVYKPDGTISPAKVELSADDITRLKSSLPHVDETIPTGVKEPAMAGAHNPAHTPGSTAHDPVRTPGGTAHDLDPSARHETPGSGHGQGSGAPHTPTGPGPVQPPHGGSGHGGTPGHGGDEGAGSGGGGHENPVNHHPLGTPENPHPVTEAQQADFMKSQSELDGLSRKKQIDAVGRGIEVNGQKYKPEAPLLKGAKHGIDWTEGPARASKEAKPQGKFGSCGGCPLRYGARR